MSTYAREAPEALCFGQRVSQSLAPSLSFNVGRGGLTGNPHVLQDGRTPLHWALDAAALGLILGVSWHVSVIKGRLVNE